MANLSDLARLVTTPDNLRYFLKRPAFGGAIYVTSKRLIYLDWNERMSPAEEIIPVRKVDRKDLAAEIQLLMKEEQLSSLSLEENAPVWLFQELRSRLPEIKIRIQSGWAEEQREIKSEWEIAQLRTACRITDEAFEAVLGKIHAGISELEIAAELEKEMRLRGADGSNKTIVAAGLHSAKPHHWPTDYLLREGDFVTMDYGCTYNGYHSDMTRTVVIGKASGKQKDIYYTVLKAQETAQKALRAGLTGGELDGIARKIIDDAGYAGTFVHNLGHGIGLGIHEGTGLIRDGRQRLKPGMVVSVEPGIYIEGFGGVRIEDIAVVRENGSEVLEHTSKELFEIL